VGVCKSVSPRFEWNINTYCAKDLFLKGDAPEQPQVQERDYGM